MKEVGTVLAHTPRWVFVVFIALLVLGFHQSRDRAVGHGRLLLLPVAMLGLSLYGVVSSFGLALLPFLAWVLGVGVVVALCTRRLKSSARPGPSGSFRMPGSWWPLALMMGIFSIRYLVGYALARNLPIAFQSWFIAVVSFSLGLLSGAFLARAGAAWFPCARCRS
jgi:hypothetical protein